MSHELEQHGDRVAFVDTRNDAWHRLNDLPPEYQGKPLTAEEALRLAHLSGWNVRKVPAFAKIGEGKAALHVPIPGSYATIRDNPWTPGQVDVLGAVGNQWTAFQNEDLAGFLNALVHESQGNIETAGSLREGREVFVTTKLPEGMTVGGTDKLDLYIAALTAHDGTKATRFIATEVRVVCKNTQRAAEAGAVSSASIRHTSGATKYVEVAREKLGLAVVGFADLEAEFERMIQTQQTEAEFAKMVDAVFYPKGDVPDPKEKSRALTIKTHRDETLLSLWADAETQANIRGTRYAGYQSVIEYLDHFAPVQGSDGDAVLAAARRAERALTNPQPERERAFAFARVPVKDDAPLVGVGVSGRHS